MSGYAVKYGAGTAKIRHGDCLEVLKTLPDNSVDSLVTDPPAGISFMGKSWDHHKGGRTEWVAWMAEVMRECLRVLKPGAHGLVWALPRTSHWTATALEDAGFEVRDCIYHLFGQGFPKSLDISKAIDKAAGAEREILREGFTSSDEQGASYAKGLNAGFKPRQLTSPASPQAKQWSGWGTALKPAVECWWLVRKPCSEKTVAANVLKWGTGGLNIDGCRIATQDNLNGGTYSGDSRASSRESFGNGQGGGVLKNGIGREFVQPSGRFPSHLVLSHSPYCTDEQCDVECAVAQLDAQSGAYDSSMVGMFACGPAKTKAAATYAGKRTESKSGNLSIDGFGSKLTAQFLRDTISITRTETCSIMSFPILSASKPMPIGTCTIETEKTTESFEAKSIASVSVASNGKCSISLASDPQAPITGTAKIVFGNISASGERKTASTGTPITANTAGPSRFFYCAKISSSERNAGLEDAPNKMLAVSNGAKAAIARGEEYPHESSGFEKIRTVKNNHPTVKPQKLMRYLCKLVTPPGGLVLDPFMGSGSTGLAALSEGFHFMGVEREAEYVAIAEKRIEAACAL